MSWKGHPYNRWVKMHKGVRYRVSCDESNAPLPTKEASYRLANSWWLRKLAELNRPGPRTEALNWTRYKMQDIEEQRTNLRAMEELFFARAVQSGYPQIDEMTTPTEKIVEYAETLAPRTDPDKTLGVQIGRFLAYEQSKGNASNTHGDLQYSTNKLLSCPFLGESYDVRIIDSYVVERVYAWVKNSGWKGWTQSHVLSAFRRLVQYLAGHEVCKMPNFLHRRWSIDTSTTIPQYPLERIRSVMARTMTVAKGRVGSSSSRTSTTPTKAFARF